MKLRRDYGWTQRELAERLEVDSVTVSRWERGVSSPRRAVARSIERLFSQASPELRLRAGVSPKLIAARHRSELPSIDELVRLVGIDVARSALRTVALRARAPRPVKFAADPVTRLREVEAALREQSDLISRAKIG